MAPSSPFLLILSSHLTWIKKQALKDVYWELFNIYINQLKVCVLLVMKIWNSVYLSMNKQIKIEHNLFGSFVFSALCFSTLWGNILTLLFLRTQTLRKFTNLF